MDSISQTEFHFLAFVNLNIPRADSTTPRPLRVRASDLEALIEVKPEGKVSRNEYMINGLLLNYLPIQEETVITVGLMDLLIEDVKKDGSVFKLLCLTSPRSLVRRLATLCERSSHAAADDSHYGVSQTSICVNYVEGRECKAISHQAYTLWFHIHIPSGHSMGYRFS